MKIEKYKKVLVVGLGFRSGLAAANFLVKKGFSVAISDAKSVEELDDLVSQLDPAIELFLGKQESNLLDQNFELIVLSPGVPRAIPLIQEALKRKIPVIGEIELAASYLEGKSLAITGTDGKSTTTAFLTHLLQTLNFKAEMGGNIGIPLTSLVDQSYDDSVTVIELSSFQLESSVDYRPDVSALLNITPDHLNRYETMFDYAKAKYNIVAQQTADDYFVYNLDDEFVAKTMPQIVAKKLTFSLKNSQADAYFDGENIKLKIALAEMTQIPVSWLKIPGVHNIQNLMTVLLMLTGLQLKYDLVLNAELLRKGISSFQGLEHRMEKLDSFAGRNFINDSKATTVGALKMALKSVKEPTVLIIGGQTKGDDYRQIIPVLQESPIKNLVLIGESTKEFAEIFQEFLCISADSMDEAVKKSFDLSTEGETILLSPACASFDMFNSFEERGKVFKAAVEKLRTGDL